MKLKELKHNHSLTDLLKVIIFSILMITPLLSVATRCLYVICNKNAYQSYSGEYTENVVLIDEIKMNNTYEYRSPIGNQATGTFSTPVVVSNLNLNSSYYGLQSWFDENKNSIYSIRIANYSSNSIRFFDSQQNALATYTLGTNDSNYVSFTALTSATITNNNYNVYYISSNNYQDIDNVFEYSVNKLAESPILSWTQQTAIYTGVNTMTTQLGVTTPTIAMLIVYWFLLTVIYIIIDIIIKLFTWLTHMIGSKSV